MGLKGNISLKWHRTRNPADKTKTIQNHFDNLAETKDRV